MRKNDAPKSSELNQLARRLKEWRNAHPPRTRLPEQLWTSAVEIARREGIYRTARSLHLDYANLRRRVETASRSPQRPLLPTSGKTSAAGGVEGGNKRAATLAAAERRRRSRTASAAFVELVTDSIGGECVIELEGRGGGRMRIRTRMSMPEVMNLMRYWEECEG